MGALKERLTPTSIISDSQLPQFSPASTEHQGRGATKRGVLYAKFQIFDDPVEEPNNEVSITSFNRSMGFSNGTLKLVVFGTWLFR